MRDLKYKIKFDATKKHEIIIEDYERKEKSNSSEIFFAEEYEKAHGLVVGILEAWEKNNSDNSGNQNGNPHNNIILFSGERGTGKTSAMRSFGKYLEKKGLAEEKFEKKNFALLPMIDPSYFRKNENIVINVIAVMFNEAKSIIKNVSKEDGNYNYTKNAYNNLLRKYEEVFNDLKNMDELKNNERSLEYLNELSDTTNLTDNIHTLIEEMLRFMANDKAKATSAGHVMVLMIDDLDMNLSLAPMMLEQIRKFLMMKDLVILISSNIEQFQLEMEGYYGKTFTEKTDPATVSIHIEDMASKYLFKLFPPSRRIHVGSTAKKLLETQIEVIQNANTEPKNK